MGAGAPGGRGPPGVRRELALALAQSATAKDAKSYAVPFDYALFQLAGRFGVPPWVFEGYPVHEPPAEWVIRAMEFARMEASVKVKRSDGST